MHDWNVERFPPRFCGFVDETIRDGLQAPNAPALSTSDRMDFIDLMVRSGITDVIVGMVGPGRENRDRIEALLRSCDERSYPIQTWLLSRHSDEDLQELVDISQSTGCDFGMNIFLCASNIRLFAEGWDLKKLLRKLERCLQVQGREFSEIRVAIEDATRTFPNTLAEVAKLAIENGATRITVADTAGISTPDGVRRIFEFLQASHLALADGLVKLEWHGHNDRGLAVSNSLESIQCGASYVHGTILGVGERNGNAALDTVILNLADILSDKMNWTALQKYYHVCYDKFRDVIAKNHPFLGENSFITSTGTHCAAIKKALEKGCPEIAQSLFSPASAYNDVESISFQVSPNSGRRSVQLVLERIGIDYRNECLIEEILDLANCLNRTLTNREIRNITEACIGSKREQSVNESQ